MAATQLAPRDAAPPAGFYCSTSGTYFTDKESLAEHYKSDFHKYNLKRKVAGLPPVTREWFEARRSQLSGAASSGAATRTWVDPLTKKKFSSENTYQAHLRSKKYLAILKKEGLAEPPAPVVTLRKTDGADAPAAGAAPVPAPAQPFTIKPATQRLEGAPAMVREVAQAADRASMEVEEEEGDDSSGWETASDADAAEMEAGEEWEQWDERRSLFDSHVSPSFEANLEYMWKRYGFYLPDADFLADPHGLLRYLGQKLRYGRVPLYTAGDDANARQFRDLHAVQRHMVDSCQCKMLYDGNEEEYAEFYDYTQGGDEQAAPAGTELVMADADLPQPAALSAGGYELVLPASDAAGAAPAPGRVLGSRDLALYYKQRHRPADARGSVAANAVAARYRALGVATQGEKEDAGTREARAARAATRNADHLRLKCSMRVAKIANLPNNVPY